MITDATTIAELAEILRRSDLVITWAEIQPDGFVYAELWDDAIGASHKAEAPTLAAALSAALAKAGAR